MRGRVGGVGGVGWGGGGGGCIRTSATFKLEGSTDFRGIFSTSINAFFTCCGDERMGDDTIERLSDVLREDVLKK